jgi:hypothetical protein
MHTPLVKNGESDLTQRIHISFISRNKIKIKSKNQSVTYESVYIVYTLFQTDVRISRQTKPVCCYIYLYYETNIFLYRLPMVSQSVLRGAESKQPLLLLPVLFHESWDQFSQFSKTGH